MQTILVPVDFSSTSYNAARYAIRLAVQLNTERIVLYNAFELPVMANGGLTAPIVIDIEEIKSNSSKALQTMQEKLKAEFNNLSVAIETLNNYNTVLNGIKEAVTELKVHLIIMGITGGSSIEQSLIGSNTIDVSRESKVPVIIVPPKAVFKQIQNTYLAYGLQYINESLPAKPITDFLFTAKSNFGILHVEKDASKKYTDNDFSGKPVNTAFAAFKPKHHIIYHTDFVEGVNNFTDNNLIDLLIIIPKKHGFFDRLFNKSHTKMLAFHSHVPIMVVHE